MTRLKNMITAIMIVLPLLAATSLVAHAQQADSCALGTPQGCLGRQVEVLMRDNQRLTGLVSSVTVDGFRYSLTEREPVPVPPGETIIGLQHSAAEASIVNLFFATAINDLGSIPPAAVDDSAALLPLLALIILALLIVIIMLLRSDQAEPAITAADDLQLVEEPPWPQDVIDAFLAEPLPAVLDQPRVSVRALRDAGLLVEETTFMAVGGGMGSFAWVDCLRIVGASSDQIRVVGVSPRPYTAYRRLCRNSQIMDQDRLRSDSGTTPDNLWGWPGYALREAWAALRQGQWRAALALIWQLIAEPVLADTYTPRLGTVCYAIEREARRIGWDSMLRLGWARCLRKTDDERYLLVYLAQEPDGGWQARVMVAPYVHLATGYNGLQLLAQLHDYRAAAGDNRFVHAYEQHDHLYQQLIDYGGRVVIRGRGIVASRILERLTEVRAENSRVSVLHIMRTPQGFHRHIGWARGSRSDHWTLQPFNWPKSAFGGIWRDILERVDPAAQHYLFGVLGGVTTANRRAWRAMIENGLREGWYQTYFGDVREVTPHDNRLRVVVHDAADQETATFMADFMIDATGLNHHPDDNPLLLDLRQHYGLQLNSYQHLDVTGDFEVVNMRSGAGRLFASGVITFGGRYAPVDSFLGLQYAAQRSADTLAAQGAPGLRPISGLYSVRQWLRWASGQQP